MLGFDKIGNLTLHYTLGDLAYPASGVGSFRPHAVCATVTTSCVTPTYQYDANGNLTSNPDLSSLVYDFENRLTSTTRISPATATTMTYHYLLGRVTKTASGATTAYIGPFYECVGGRCTKYILAGDLRVAMESGTTVTYFHPDHLGSTSVVTKGTDGTKDQQMTYYPFGETRTLTDGSGTPISPGVPYKYTDQELDPSTGLYFYKARYYDAHLGRFIQPDTLVSNPYVPAAWNRYTYVMNNPLKYTDPTGHEAWDAGFVPGLIVPSMLMQTANQQQINSGDPLGINYAVAGFAYGVSLYNSLGSSASGTVYTVSNGTGQSGDILSRITEGERATVAAAGSEIYFNMLHTGNEYGAAIGRDPSSGEYIYQPYPGYSPYGVDIRQPPQGTILQARIHGHPTTPGFSPDDLTTLSRSAEVQGTEWSDKRISSQSTSEPVNNSTL